MLVGQEKMGGRAGRQDTLRVDSKQRANTGRHVGDGDASGAGEEGQQNWVGAKSQGAQSAIGDRSRTTQDW